MVAQGRPTVTPALDGDGWTGSAGTDAQRLWQAGYRTNDCPAKGQNAFWLACRGTRLRNYPSGVKAHRPLLALGTRRGPLERALPRNGTGSPLEESDFLKVSQPIPKPAVNDPFEN